MATTSKNLNHYVLILCGGSGPRLWPISRAENPKQFLSIFSKNSFLEETINRSLQIVPPENVFLISNKKYKDRIKKLLNSNIPPKNIIHEPDKKNTAMAILYATTIIQNHNQNAVITVFPSDHYIKKVKDFNANILKTADLAQKYNSIVTIGIKPNNPSTSFGYILSKKKSLFYRTVTKFIEKPDLEKASELIKKGSFWNSGIYTFSVSTLINEFQKQQPQYFKLYVQLKESLNDSAIIENIYKNSPNLSIDFAISEKSKNLIMIPAKFIWSDVGEWKSIFNQLPKNNKNIASLDSDLKYLEVNSKNCLISTSKKKLIGLVNVNNLAIIDTPDALLVCNIASDGSYHVRDIVRQIMENKELENYFLKNPKND